MTTAALATATAPAAPAAPPVAAAVEDVSSDAAFAAALGFNMGDASDDAGGEGEADVSLDDVATALAGGVVPEAPAAAPAKPTTPDKPAEGEALTLEALRKVASDRSARRDQRTAAETQLRAAEAQLADRDTELAALRARAAQLDEFERDPAAWAEKYNRDPVPIMQRFHKQVLNPAARQEASLAELRAEVETLKQALGESEARTVERAVETQTTVAAKRAHRREFVAVSEAEEFPLLKLEEPERRLELAQEAFVALKNAGHTNINHELVARTLENSLRAEIERKAQAIGLRPTSDSSTQSTAAQAGGKAAPAGATNGSATRGAARTITQEQAATPPAERPLTEREQDALAVKVIAEIFGGGG